MDTEKEILTPERITAFLQDLREKGRSPGSLQNYRRILLGLYEYLPEEKLLTSGTWTEWKEWLVDQGFSPRTVNARLSALNSFFLYAGRKGWVQDDFFRGMEAVQPELTRSEYLRLLQTAKLLGREKSYLIIKTLGGAGLRVQELHQLTAEAVRRGAVVLQFRNHSKERLLRIPKSLQAELLDYIQREGIKSGPVFLTPEGAPLRRSSIYHYVNCVSKEAQVSGDKANPRCLWKMYQNTYESIQANISVLIEQAYERMLEDEQLLVGRSG